MKSIRWVLLAILGIAMALFFVIPKLKKSDLKAPQNSFFLPLDITEFSLQKVPYLSTRIENRELSLLLDIGSSDDVALILPVLNQLQDKTYLQQRQHCGFRGKVHESATYKIPKLQIGNLTFWEPSLSEETGEFQVEGSLDVEPSAVLKDGRLGWHLFTGSNLLLDLGCSKIAFADSFSTIQNRGYAHVPFAKVPLLRDRGILEIEAEVNHQRVRCLLDTGATWNLLNSEEEGCAAIHSSITINQVAFDPIVLHTLPIHLPFPVDVILGMEFFREHIVFIDFAENSVYIARSTH